MFPYTVESFGWEPETFAMLLRDIQNEDGYITTEFHAFHTDLAPDEDLRKQTSFLPCHMACKVSCKQRHLLCSIWFSHSHRRFKS